MVRIKVDLNGAKKKLEVKNVDRGRYAAANQMLADMTPYIPAREFTLRNTGSIGIKGDSLVWSAPYARKMFYMYMNNYTTPGTGPRWDNKAKSLHMQDWLNAFVKGAGW